MWSEGLLAWSVVPSSPVVSVQEKKSEVNIVTGNYFGISASQCCSFWLYLCCLANPAIMRTPSVHCQYTVSENSECTLSGHLFSCAENKNLKSRILYTHGFIDELVALLLVWNIQAQTI